jgi:hypothetical protein
MIYPALPTCVPAHNLSSLTVQLHARTRQAFYGLHRHEVLERPQYACLQIGVLRGEQSVITGRLVGSLSSVPFAEPTYLTEGFPARTTLRYVCYACACRFP